MGTWGKGRGSKWNDIKIFDLVKDDKWRSLTTGNRSTLPRCSNEGVVLYG